MSRTKAIELPAKLARIFSPPRGSVRWRVAHGGRGSGKSYSFALMAAVWGAVERLRILCVREYQTSIPESFYAELKEVIEKDEWLKSHYVVGRDYIHGKNGTTFFFRGLRFFETSIKSLAKIDLCIVEEAEDVASSSWIALEPTIREPKSEFWVIFNPKRRDSWVAEKFLPTNPEDLPPRALIAKVNHYDNPWFSDVLEEQRLEAQKKLDPALYRWVWEGEFYENSRAQVFANAYQIQEFEADPRKWDGPYLGLDFGFSQDATAAVRAWVFDGRLWIDHDLAKVGLELDDTADAVRAAIPGAEKHVIRADSARPDSISLLKRTGLPRIVACRKGKGSVEDGIALIRSLAKVVIHPRCKATNSEFSLYSYRIDRLSGDVLADPVDAYNHNIDALRYALEPLTRRGSILTQQRIM